MSLEHFLNSSVVVWGSCRLPCESLVSKHVPWLQVWAASQAGHLLQLLGQLGCLADLCPCAGTETQALPLHVFSLPLQPIYFTSVAAETVWCQLGVRGGVQNVVSELVQCCPWQRQTSAWPDKKPLLQLALLYPVGVFSAVIAEVAPKCRNLSGTHKASSSGGSEQENRRSQHSPELHWALLLWPTQF